MVFPLPKMKKAPKKTITPKQKLSLSFTVQVKLKKETAPHKHTVITLFLRNTRMTAADASSKEEILS